jgi:putative ABC transport system permease protein
MFKGTVGFFRDCTHIVALVFADLRFEWILSLCMILSLGAVFAPLFILLGLQEGIIGNMLDKLQRDPVSRLVKPKWEGPLDDAWLASLREQRVALVESPTAFLLLDVEGMDDPVNALPTDKNDPILLENDITLADWKESLVLSAPLAQSIGKQAGSSFTLTLIRSAGREERIPLQMKVAGILPTKVSQDSKIWLDAELFRRIHQWRRGGAVPELSLGGGRAVLEPEYDGIVTLLEKVPSDAEYRTMIGRGMSFSQLPQPFDLSLWGYAAEQQVRLWKPVNSRLFEQNFKSLISRHHEMGYSVKTLPYFDDFKVDLRSDGKNISLTLASLLPKEEIESSGSTDAVQHVWIAQDEKISFPYPKATMSFSTAAHGEEITIPVRVHPSVKVPSGYIAVDPRFAGKMNAAHRQGAVYDQQAGEFRPIEQGVRFFRAYANSIDDLEALVEFIRAEGVRRSSEALQEPVSRVAEVRDIRQLAGYMKKLYLLILSVSGISGFFAILASVYAGIQRKRKDIAYLALFGLHPLTLILFPFFKSLVLVSAALCGSLAAYGIFGYWADRIFTDALGNTASLTRLAGQQTVLLVSAVYITASLASLIAAVAVTRIEPGEYIRE